MELGMEKIRYLCQCDLGLRQSLKLQPKSMIPLDAEI